MSNLSVSGKIAYLGVIFFIFNCAFNSELNMIGQILDTQHFKNYGQVCLITLSVSTLSWGFFVPKVANKFGYKNSLIFSTLFYITQYITGLFPSLCEPNQLLANSSLCSQFNIKLVLVFGFFVVGFGSDLFWLCQAGYIANLSDHTNKAKNFGLFWLINQPHKVIGNLLAAFVLGSFYHSTFYCMLLGLCIMSSFLMIGLKDVPIKNKTNEIPIKVQLTSIFELIFKSKKLRPLLLICNLSGVIAGFDYVFIYQLVEESIHKVNNFQLQKQTAFVYAVMGAGQMCGSQVMGKLGDYLNNKLLIIYTVIIMIIGTSLGLADLYLKYYWFSFIIGFVLGFTDASLQVLISSVITKDFMGNLNIFSVFRMFISFGALIVYILRLTTPLKVCVLVLIFIQIISLIIYYFLINLKNNSQLLEEIDQNQYQEEIKHSSLKDSYINK